MPLQLGHDFVLYYYYYHYYCILWCYVVLCVFVSCGGNIPVIVFVNGIDVNVSDLCGHIVALVRCSVVT